MIIFLIILPIFIAFVYCWRYKVHIYFKSFLRKGFRKRDDDYGLYCFVADQGGGKTFSVVDALDDLGKGKTIVTNVHSYYERHKENCEYEPNFFNIYTRFSQIDDCSKYIIFYDELFSVLDSKGLNRDIREFTTQFRKRKIHMFTTAQVWSSIPYELRKLTRYQISTKMFNLPLFNCALLVNEINDGYSIKWDSEAQEYICPRLKTNIKKCSLKAANGYDTNETIKGYCIITK